jgi:Galactose oxidase, central domain
VTDGCTTASAETFLVSSDGTTTSGPPLSTARDSHTANVLPDGRVVFVGGYPGEGAGVLDSIDIVDPTRRKATTSLRLATGRGGHASALIGSSRVVVIGGWVAPRTYTASVEIINGSVLTMTRGTDLPWAADALDAVPLDNGLVLVTGGQIQPDVATTRAALYDPETDRWAELPAMATPRYKHFSVLLPDGRALVIGGDTGDQTITATTEIFDPETNTFSAGPNLTEPRYKFPGGALVLRDGRVIIAGGGTTTEVLDIDARKSTTVGTPGRVRSFATLNQLGNGDLLIVGGYDDQITLGRTSTIISRTQLPQR